MKKLAIYPGTFDPITNGHLDVIISSSKIFEKVIVAVAESREKKPTFSLKNRVEMAQLSLKNLKNVAVEPFDNLLADFAREHNCSVLIRGLRTVSDFEYELQVAYANSTLNPSLQTIYFMPTLKNAFVSSTMVRSIMLYGGNIEHLVSPEVSAFIAKNYKAR